MWLWGLLAWGVVSVAAAWLHHRMYRVQPAWPPEVAAFLVRFENEIAARHRGVQFLGMLPERFACLLRVDGQETPVGLHDAFRHAEAFPDGFQRMVERLLQDVRAIGLDRVDAIDFLDAASMLLPQVRSREWLAALGRFGDAALVHRPLNDELVVVYVLDDPQCMVFVCRAHLARWRKSADDLHNLAIANLRRLGVAGLDRVGEATEPLLLQTGDGYDAARVLLLEQTEGLLVAIPDRDTLWIGREQGQDLASLMATTEGLARDAAHPVSPHLWQVKDGHLQALPVRR